MTTPFNGADTMDALLDIPEVFRPVVSKYGRAMYALVMNAGMAGQAAEVAGAVAAKANNPQLARAILTLVEAFNQVSNAYVKVKGWEEADVAMCDRDMQLAFAAQPSAPTKKIILDS